jgi:prepilin-type N-terminal cleavage/methylation domain-containing protein
MKDNDMPQPMIDSPVPFLSRTRRAGFTLIEVLVTVGIIAVVLSLSLAGILLAKKHAIVIRTRSDLQLIESALSYYKQDMDGQYPVFADPSTDQASNAILGNGQWLDYSGVNGSSAGARGAVLLCRALIGPGPANSTPGISASTYYASPGDDGADGSGFRTRRIYNASTGQFSGKVYGPYVDSAKFKLGYLNPTLDGGQAFPVILDSGGYPILYYPAASGIQQANLNYNNPQTTSINVTSRFNGYDNNYYVNSTGSGSSFSTSSAFATLAAGCGSPNYLLWTAGADGVFGLDSKGKSDDIANFDLPGQYQK